MVLTASERMGLGRKQAVALGQPTDTLGVFTERAFGLQVTCDEAGADFQFSGCTENVCSAGSGDRTGYDICQYDAANVDAPVAEAMGVAGTCEALLNDPCGARPQ